MVKSWWLLALVSILAVLSLLILRSVTPRLVLPQTIFFGLGFAVWWVVSQQPFSTWQKWSSWFYLGLNVLLLVILISGNVTRGSTRWISVGGVFNVQGSQLAIPLTCLYLSHLLKNGPILKLKEYLWAIGVIALPAALIFVEPDLGTTIVFVAAVAGQIFLATHRAKFLITSVGLATAAIIFSWFFLLKPYQKERVTAFLNPHVDTSGAGYNAQQSLIAVGSGQTWGRGLGQGVQSHLRFLPERQTDFIFASLAEELGLIGTLGLLGLYSLLCYSIWQVGSKSREWGAQLFCWSMVCMIAFQSSVNIAMNIGLIPVTGLTLPFLSYGGSSILSLAFSFGIIQSISHHPTPHPKRAIT